ncbi:MAG: 16S rRNA (adenine(1518)-N(6)/adenine(1519)-N(6))-dimethyltransferase [Propionibacteriaceae bacterium]|jgi:16S rRNA (adenine1518-N6/adenine1519-N6)-dimethyltransferase|nr:16S rRNA (adenine(1518)-N(6)/adenine(1519)-N(6))-dimethyltransferase [Propionibacteriaceae bacterium]
MSLVGRRDGRPPVTALLDPSSVRRLAAELQLRPSKRRGQNFVIDANTVRRIVEAAGVGPDDTVLEIGPGLGSLTAGLLAAGARVVAVEVEPALARRLPQTMAELGLAGPLPSGGFPGPDDSGGLPGPGGSGGFPRDSFSGPREDAYDGAWTGADGPLWAVEADALAITALPGPPPTCLVANLPYNVAVPALLHALAAWPTLTGGLVMVQLEVADRLAAPPGSKVYGIPSAKLAWHAAAARAGTVPASVFWPKPNVESGLVRLTRRDPPASPASRQEVFALVDAAFARRRKMLRSALADRYEADRLRSALAAAGISPEARGETLGIEDFARLAGYLKVS